MYPSEGNASLSCLQHKTEAEPLSDAFLGIPNTMLLAVDTQCSGIATVWCDRAKCNSQNVDNGLLVTYLCLQF